jgi:hypothetical protein
MIVTTKIVYDFDGNVLEHDWYDYIGPVAFCKGDSVAKAQESSQAAFNTQLQSTFATQFSAQQKVLTYLQGKLQPMIDKPTGYDAATLTAMRTSSTDQTSAAYQNAQKTLQNRATQMNGGSDLPSGTQDQLQAALLQSEASDKASGQNAITVQNANLANSNYWNSVNALGGQAATMNPLGYAGAATSGSGAVAGLSQAYTASQGPGVMGLLGSLAGGAGTALSGSKLMTCWIAAKVFGESFYGPGTVLVRDWLTTHLADSWYGRMILRLYSQYGRQLSLSPIAVCMFTPVFKMILASAKRGI